MFNVRVVCEGVTDVEVLYAVLDAHLGGRDYTLTSLQPELTRTGGDAGPYGGGWKGVRGWCWSIAQNGGFEAMGVLTQDTDLLIIHVDADIAYDAEIGVSMPCPPPSDTMNAIENVVLGWLSLSSLPPKVVLWVPTMATEAWLLRVFLPNLPHGAPCVGLSGGGSCAECLHDPARSLLGWKNPQLVRLKSGALKKLRQGYKESRQTIAQEWQRIVGETDSAARLEAQLRVVLP